jgi:hypothetical protein
MKRHTEDLIALLAAASPRVDPHAAAQRLALGLAVGGAATAACTVLILGLRPDLGQALGGMSFWMKAAYTLALAGFGILGVAQIGRPEAGAPDPRWVLLPFGLLAVAAGHELAMASPDHRMTLLLGESWRACPRNILLLAVPLYMGLLWVFRRLAPTRLRAAGAIAGLASGGVAATIYGLHCPETSMLFVLVWYSLGIALAVLAGALLGRRLLSW